MIKPVSIPYDRDRCCYVYTTCRDYIQWKYNFSTKMLELFDVYLRDVMGVTPEDSYFIFFTTDNIQPSDLNMLQIYKYFLEEFYTLDTTLICKT